MRTITISLMWLLLAMSSIAQCVTVLPPQQKGVARLWSQPSKHWPSAATLTVSFIDGTSRQMDAAWQRFQDIDRLCGLSFRLIAPSSPLATRSTIRVTFKASGHWSYVGKDCLTVAIGQPTMSLSLMAGVLGDSKAEWDRVCLHEVMHAIGFEHEHQHPTSAIPWDVRAVYSFYQSTQGWAKAEVDRQVLKRYVGTWVGTSPDKDSLMQYPVPNSLTKGDWEVGWNDKLSLRDVTQLQKTYPLK